MGVGSGGGGGGAKPPHFLIFMNKIILIDLLMDSARSKITASRKELITYICPFSERNRHLVCYFYRQFRVLGVKEHYMYDDSCLPSQHWITAM